MAQASPRQLLNTSWTLHRLSPLHHAKEFKSILDNSDALKTYAARLRDQLTGDLYAGLQAGGAADEDASLSKTGALKECTWETLSTWPQLDDDQSSLASSQDSLGILIILEYENITYKAALLAGLDNPRTTARKDSTFLPLLLTRLPNALRQTFISFLSTNFDTYCSLLRLPSTFMGAGLEVYFGVFMSTASQRAMLEDVVKEMQLTLAFSSSIAPQLRSLNVNIPRGSCTSFINGSNRTDSAFLSGLSSYLEKHLAMKLDLGDSSSTGQSVAKQHVRLSKIACGGFVLGSEGRIKLVASPGRPESSTEDSEDHQSEKDRLIMRASEALLRAVIQRIVPGENQTT